LARQSRFPSEISLNGDFVDRSVSCGQGWRVPSLRISELFASLQGEGVSIGAPATFLRLGDCNLDCHFCDTPYSWDWSRYDRKTELVEEDVLVTASRIRSLAPRRLVITGGEPLLQQTAIAALAGELPEFLFEVETNGTVAPSEELRAIVHQWNVSPKLASSAVVLHHRRKLEVLEALRTTERAWLKFVVCTGEDLQEIEDIVVGTRWPRDRVILMPEAKTPAQLAERSPEVAKAALDHGYRFSTRLHVMLWGDVRGR
jgi:organic radical activating enzyme